MALMLIGAGRFRNHKRIFKPIIIIKECNRWSNSTVSSAIFRKTCYLKTSAMRVLELMQSLHSFEPKPLQAFVTQPPPSRPASSTSCQKRLTQTSPQTRLTITCFLSSVSGGTLSKTLQARFNQKTSNFRPTQNAMNPTSSTRRLSTYRVFQ
ncbi:hypothetical protein FGO68_gene10966 [Halteria grandinella]|uniref:Uncharacterized protein n=1 Tax=Halteria grandinella TaxID=5974 RepID=A0A8J8T545_HALGN|nr:hypothetical protein FGO68_gene10966 [Halteria grandinella]